MKKIMMKSIYNFIFIISVLFMLSACAVFKPETRSDVDIARVPDSFHADYSYNDVSASNIWWMAFNDEQLNWLVEKALTNNMNIAQAEARLRQAKAVAVIQGAARFPVLDFNGNAGVRRDKIQTPTGESKSVKTENYKLELVAGYELDLWGRINSLHKTALMNYEASVFDLETMRISVSATVVLRYYELIFQQKRLDILKSQLERNKQILYLMELRFSVSQATALDVFQQRQLVASVAAKIPLVESTIEELKNELSVLTGVMPGELRGLQRKEIPVVAPVANVGVPANLLANRPDVSAAMMRLRGADWQVSAAKADRLPAIRLTAGGGYSSTDMSKVFDNWFYNLAGSLTGPLFDAGRRRAEVDRTMAVVDERLANYRQVVLSAMQEVENLLVQEKKGAELLKAQERQLHAAVMTRKQAGERYRKGLETYLPVLTALNSSQELESIVIMSRYKLLSYRIGLIRALGGGMAGGGENF